MYVKENQEVQSPKENSYKDCELFKIIIIIHDWHAHPLISIVPYHTWIMMNVPLKLTTNIN